MAGKDPLQEALDRLVKTSYVTVANELCRYVEGLESKLAIMTRKLDVAIAERDTYRKERRELQTRLDEIENPTGAITR